MGTYIFSCKENYNAVFYIMETLQNPRRTPKNHTPVTLDGRS